MTVVQSIISRTTQKQDADLFYKNNLEEVIQESERILTEEQFEQYLDVLHASSLSDSLVVGTHLLASRIPKHLGHVEEGDIRSYTVIKPQHEKLFFEIAKEAAAHNPRYDTDIIYHFPEMIIRHGHQKAAKFARVAIHIDEEDFPEEHNVATFYAGMKGRARFAGDQQEHERLVNLVEHKYLNRPLRKQHVFTAENIGDFCEGISRMRNPRQRRAMLQSIYAELIHGNDWELDANSLEQVADSLQQYGFGSHAEKLLNRLHYKDVKEYDDTILVVSADSPDVPFSQAVITRDVRKLNSMYGLEVGVPLSREETTNAFTLRFGTESVPVIITAKYFCSLAAATGSFFGVPLKEAESDIEYPYISMSEDEGFVELFEHEGVEFLSPTEKMKPDLEQHRIVQNILRENKYRK